MTRNNGSGNAEALRAEIRQTRAELGETVQALAAKADVKARVRRRAGHTADTVRASVHDAGSAVLRSPASWAAVAAGVLAIGIVVLVLRGRHG